MSDELSKLPPQVQQRLLRLQQLQQTLQTVLTQKQHLELELTEVDQALSELEKTNRHGSNLQVYWLASGKV